MAGVADDELEPIGPWPQGIDNTSTEGSQPKDACRDATNVDFDNVGWPRTRPGATQMVSGTQVHSLWGDPDWPFGLYVDGGVLHMLDEDGNPTSLGVTVATGLPVSYDRINDKVYWSNGVESGLVTLDPLCYPWSPEQPDGQPTLTPATRLALDPGQYQVAVTFRDVLGRESGTTLAAVVCVCADGGITVTDIPQPNDNVFVPWVLVYLSATNGDVLRLHSILPAGQTSLVIGMAATGYKLATQFLVPMPAGHFVRYHNGRQYVACGCEVRWSPALRYGLWDPSKDRVRFPQTIDMLQPVADGNRGAGVFVASGEKVYFFDGANPNEYPKNDVLKDGVVRGTGTVVPGDILGLDAQTPVPVWISKRGHFWAGLPGGEVRRLSLDHGLVDAADSGAMLLRESTGIRQLIASLKAPRPQAMTIGDVAIAEILYAAP